MRCIDPIRRLNWTKYQRLTRRIKLMKTRDSVHKVQPQLAWQQVQLNTRNAPLTPVFQWKLTFLSFFICFFQIENQILLKIDTTCPTYCSRPPPASSSSLTSSSSPPSSISHLTSDLSYRPQPRLSLYELNQTTSHFLQHHTENNHSREKEGLLVAQGFLHIV